MAGPSRHIGCLPRGDKTILAQFVSADEIGDGDTLVPCCVVHILEKGESARQRLLDSVENLTEDSVQSLQKKYTTMQT